jgi:PAS domain S-box-containing protein
MQTDLPLFQRRQLEVIARVTPHAMAGHILNTTVLAVAIAGSIPTTELILWCVYSYAIALVLLYRHVRGRGRVPRNFGHAASRATVYALLLALPWGAMSVLHLGEIGRDQELVLLALVVGMAASGTVLLSAVPSAAFSYMSGILVPGAVKCLILLDQRVYLLLGVLALSYWWFLAALIMKIAREITEREQAEGKLRETEGELRRLLGALTERTAQLALAEKSALVGSFAYDVHTDTLQISDGYAAIHGFPNETKEIARSRWLAGVHPEDRARVDELRRRAFSTRSPEYTADFRIVRAGGEVRWIEGRAFVAYRDDGSPQRVASVNIDVTERKRAEAALEEGRARYRALYDDNPSMYFTVDAVGTVLSVNEFGAQQLGHTPAELVGRSVMEVVYEGDREQARRWLASCAEKAGRIATTEMRKVRRDGSTIWVREVARAVQGIGGQALIIVCEDITERKKAELALAEREAQLGLAGKAARVGSFVVDYATLLIHTSPGFAAIHGWAEETDELTCEEWRAHLFPDDVAHFEALRSRVFAERRRELNMEYRIVGADGEARWIESRGLVSYDGDGRPTRLVGVHIDITERKRAEDQQRRLVAELDHRVKNVLATVQAVAARTMQASSSMEHFVGALDGRIRSMGSTHELLSHRRWLGIPLAELVEREVAPYTTGSNTEIGGPEVMLRAEVAQTIAMVLHELVTNAAKHGALSTPSGRVSIRWRLPLNGSAGDRLVLIWREAGGPLVVPPRKSNYGMQVVRELVPYELGGTVDLLLAPEGVRCQMEIPLVRLSHGSSQDNGFALAYSFHASDYMGGRGQADG